MTWVRSLVSALIIVVGASLIASWAVAGVVVRAVEDGTAVTGIVERSLEDPAVVEALGDSVTQAALGALDKRGIDLERLRLDELFGNLVTEAVDSDVFATAVLLVVEASHEQLSEQLTASLASPAPLVIEVDLSTWVNTQIDGIPVVGAVVPDVQVPSVTFTVLDAATFQEVRSAYDLVEFFAVWALWIGIAVVVIGMFVTGRLRWFLTKLGGVLGAIAGGLYLLLHYGGLESLAAVLLGGSNSTLAHLVTGVVTEAAVPALELRLLTVAAWSLIGGLIFFLIGVLTMPRPRSAMRR